MAPDPYPNGHAVAAGLRAFARQSPRDTEAVRSEFYHDRFLSRVFHGEGLHQWVLAGGTGMLARVAESRTTKDADLITAGGDLEKARTQLDQAAQLDLGDHLLFTPTSQKTIGGTNEPEPIVAGLRRKYEVSVAADPQTSEKVIGSVTIDLVTKPFDTRAVEQLIPANRLNLPRLPQNNTPFALYPVEAQISDKIIATLDTRYGASTREKDLVDLVILAKTQPVDLGSLAGNLDRQLRIRNISPPPPTFHVPDSWGANYANLAKHIPACRDHTDIRDAVQLVQDLTQPAFDHRDTPSMARPPPS